jgi:hypothetical protein
MPAPKRPNTAAATAAVIRKAQDRKAAELREAGWLVVPPERLGDLVRTLASPADAPAAAGRGEAVAEVLAAASRGLAAPAVSTTS